LKRLGKISLFRLVWLGRMSIRTRRKEHDVSDEETRTDEGEDVEAHGWGGAEGGGLEGGTLEGGGLEAQDDEDSDDVVAHGGFVEGGSLEGGSLE
jgi:hypothetical protein